MSAHYSKWSLNTYRSTPYFQAHVPENYPLDLVLMKSRAFRRLPPRLRELSALAKKWVWRDRKPDPDTNSIDRWYDEEGYELNPSTGKRLTDKEIDEEWKGIQLPKDFKVEDIPEPAGGFADPDTWMEPKSDPEDSLEEDRISEEHLLKDIEGWGREYVAKDYGVDLKGIKDDKELAQAILSKPRRAG